VFPLSFTLDHVGPMTRTVADNALLLNVIAGHDAADPGSAPGPSGPFDHLLDRGIGDLRIGFVQHFHQTDLVADTEVAAALEQVALTLRDQGARVRPVALPSLTEFAAVNRVILTSEAWSIHAPWLRGRPGDYGQLSRRRLMAGAFVSAGDYVGAQRRRKEMIAAVEDAFRDVDILLCASSMDPASAIEDAEATGRTYPRQARTPFNVTGHPALAMMSGLSRGGLPLSVQFVGRYFEDATVLRAAAAWERASGGPKHPPIE
jgi:aspartyl-tRNA(Asn)/glutamyl-tRNA(Gln) amidotransferase subunit A